jgi:hypothetical protein
MQTKTILALICTIVVLLIGVNDGKPTTTSTVAVKPDPSVAIVQPAVVKHVGRKQWKTKIDPKSKKLFDDYKKTISKKLLTVHKIAIANPKPDKVASQKRDLVPTQSVGIPLQGFCKSGSFFFFSSSI